jgi:hypothetical protein
VHEADGFSLPGVAHAGQLTYLQSTAIERARTELWFDQHPEYSREGDDADNDVPEWVENEADQGD